MKSIIIALFMAVTMVVPTLAAELSGSVSTKLLTQYVASNGVVLHDQAVQQTDIFLQLSNGLYADIWVSLPWNGKNNFGKETDWTLGWSGSIPDSKVVADVGISYYDYINLFKSAGDVFNPFLKLSYDIPVNDKQTLTPYIKGEYAIPVHSDNVDGGAYAYLGLKHVWNALSYLAVNQDLSAIYDGGAYDLDTGFEAKYALMLNWKIASAFTIDTGVTAFTPISDFSDNRKTEIVPSIGLTGNF